MNIENIAGTTSKYARGLNLQAESATVVTPGVAVLSPGTLYVGTTGDVEVVTASGETVTFANVANGAFIPVLVIGVTANTTADDILILR